MSDSMEYTSAGQVQIANEVIEIIAATASQEVEGVLVPAMGTAQGIVEFFGKKSQSRGAKIAVEDGHVSVDMDITVRFGAKLIAVAEAVQQKVKNAIETMTNYAVDVVNVNITAITLEKVKEEAEAE